MTYTVIARRYRPQTFEEVVGQEHIVVTLRNAITEQKIAHAYLFAGPRGTGKTSTARLLAKALNCTKGPSPTPCNKCEICRSVTEGVDPDVIEMDAASNRGIDEIRTLREGVGYVPLRARYKVYILDEAHQLSRDAFNALLKTLEEPPPHVKFIFATTEPHKMPDTIISRCQRFYFRRISTQDILTRLQKICKKEKLKYEPTVLTTIAQAAAGSMRDAESLLDQLVSYRGDGKATSQDLELLLGATSQNEIFDLFDGLIQNDLARIINIVNRVFTEGRDLNLFLEQIIQHIWYLIVAGVSQKSTNLLEAEVVQDKERYLAQSPKIGLSQLMEYNQILSEAKRNLKETSNPRVLLELALIRLTQKNTINTPSTLKGNEAPRNKPRVAGAEFSRRQPAPSSSQPVRTRYPAKENKPAQKAETPSSPAEPTVPASTATNDKEELSDSTPLQLTEEIKPLWPNLVEQVKAKSIKAYALLREGHFVSADNTEVTVGFLPSHNFHRRLLEESQNKRIVEDVITEMLGRKLNLTLSVLPDEATPTDLESTNQPSPEKDKTIKPTVMPSENTNISSFQAKEELRREVLKNPTIQKVLETFEGRIVNVEE